MEFSDPIVKNIEVTVDKPFEIVLKEQPIILLAWEPHIPELVELIDTERHFEGVLDIVTFKFVCHELGTFPIRFEYRKTCCDKRMISNCTYNIIVQSPTESDA